MKSADRKVRKLTTDTLKLVAESKLSAIECWLFNRKADPLSNKQKKIILEYLCMDVQREFEVHQKSRKVH